MREVAAEFERPVLLFSGGKDSIVMLRLAEKAFWPGRIPFPVMHVDTGHNFAEVIDFRDRRVAELGVQLVVASVQESIDSGPGRRGDGSARQPQPAADHDPARRHRGARVRRRVRRRSPRRGEGPGQGARLLLPRRVRSVGPEEPAARAVAPLQRPHRKGEHIRVFPISNWTELDVWQYIEREDIEIPSIYYAHRREVFRRDGMWLAVTRLRRRVMDDEEVVEMLVRYRTVGDASCTGAVESAAITIEDVIIEVAASRITERGATRADDKFTEAAMEDRKKEGYF